MYFIKDRIVKKKELTLLYKLMRMRHIDSFIHTLGINYIFKSEREMFTEPKSYEFI